MQNLDKAFKLTKSAYDAGGSPLVQLRAVARHSLGLLLDATAGELPSVSAGGKQYSIFRAKGNAITRPFLPGLLLHDVGKFETAWDEMVAAVDGHAQRIALPAAHVNSVLYTATMSFCLCYDLWKPKSRKTPGTQFEVILGSILKSVLPGYARTKYIPLGDGESVSTDIVMADGKGRALVFPAKITTRERIVQPFAHQRILDSVFGQGRYRSILACVSEMQRDEEEGANEICVPGTIRLFQRHLAPIAGIYYLDPPVRYLQEDLTSIVRVGSIGELLTHDLPNLLR